MESVVQRRRLAALSPFSGDTLAPPSMLELETLCRVLQTIVGRVEEEGHGGRLLSVTDRHEVDGTASESREVSWSWLRQLGESPNMLYSARSGEPLVSIGFYCEQPLFYLRVNIMEEDEDEVYPGRWGDFDFTASSPCVSLLQKALSSIVDDLEVEPAASYFGNRSAL